MNKINIGISKEALLEATGGGLDIIESIYTLTGVQFNGLGKRNLNPFYNDTKASLYFNQSGETILFNDFGDPDYGGDVFDFAGKYYNINPKLHLNKLLEAIASDLRIDPHKLNGACVPAQTPFSKWNIKTNSNLQNKNNELVLNNNKDVLVRFNCYEHEEQAAVYEYEANLPKQVANKKVIEEFNLKSTDYERLYRLAVNYKVVDKNINPNTNKQYSNYTAFNNNFENVTLTTNELIETIKQGHLVCNSTLKGNHRTEKNFVGSELVFIDVDGGLTLIEALQKELTKTALFIYTTCSHTQENNRFRIVFELPTFITDKDIYKKIALDVTNHYNADKQCASVSRPFYGNRKALIIDIRNKKYYDYTQGGKNGQ